MITYESWPFRTFQQRTVEDNARWWQHCYVPAPVAEIITTVPQWTLLSGGAGSGKTVTMQALRQDYADTIFFVDYLPSQWPGGIHVPHPQDKSHLPQMLATAALAIRDYLLQNPATGQALTGFELEFLHWLLTNYVGPRAFARMLRYFTDEAMQSFQSTPQQDLFAETPENLIVQAQIDELVSLIRALGFAYLIFAVDLAYPGTPAEKEGLADLFGWLELAHHPGFAVIAAVPDTLLADGMVVSRARGRARSLNLRWTHQSCEQIAHRHIQQGTGNNLGLLDLVDGELLAQLTAVMAAEYGGAAPAGWVALAEALLYLRNRSKGSHKPFSVADVEAITRTFFTRHMLLSIDPDVRGVWRGPKYIQLDDQPLAFIHLLYQRRGHPINWSDTALRNIAGSPDNVYSIARRTRVAIEPVPESPIYLLNKRGEGGYKLENIKEP